MLSIFIFSGFAGDVFGFTASYFFSATLISCLGLMFVSSFVFEASYSAIEFIMFSYC